MDMLIRQRQLPRQGFQKHGATLTEQLFEARAPAEHQGTGVSRSLAQIANFRPSFCDVCRPADGGDVHAMSMQHVGSQPTSLFTVTGMLPGKRGDTEHRKLKRHANLHKDTLSNPVVAAWVSSGRMGWRLIQLQLGTHAMCRVAIPMEPYTDGTTSQHGENVYAQAVSSAWQASSPFLRNSRPPAAAFEATTGLTAFGNLHDATML